jgi:hypothetical protein
LTLTRTSPSMERPTINRLGTMDRTEDPEAFGQHRRVEGGLTNWSTGVSPFILRFSGASPSPRVSGSMRTVTDACYFCSQSAFGVNIAGEYSNGFNDCAFWLRGPGNTETVTPNCDFWTNSANWNATVKEGLMNFALASMDALMYPFFWTWKVSHVLIYHLGGAIGATVSLSWSRLAIRASALAFVPSQLARAAALSVFLMPHATGPKNNPYLYFSPSLCHLESLFFHCRGFIGPPLSSEVPGPRSGDSGSMHRLLHARIVFSHN